MPRGDGTGPAGMGPMTGRAAGFCAGYSAPGFMNPIPGRGYGFGGGRGFGRGMGRGFRGGFGFGMGRAWGAAPYATPYGAPYAAVPNAQQESDALKGQAEYLETALGDIKKRLSELESEQNKD